MPTPSAVRTGTAAPGVSPSRRPASRFAAVGLGLAVAVAALGALTVAARTVGGVPSPVAADVSTVASVPSAAAASVPGPVTVALVPAAPVPAAPVRAASIDIPKLGVRGDLIDLNVDAAGVLQPPPTADVAGWFTGAAAPGEPGPTVIAGHVDSRDGPGVFFALKDLAPGDLVDVGRSDGGSARYRVTEVLTVAKDAFPTQRVYGPTSGPELRLITCGGEFDRASGHYLRNVVVSAVLVDNR